VISHPNGLLYDICLYLNNCTSLPKRDINIAMTAEDTPNLVSFKNIFDTNQLGPVSSLTIPRLHHQGRGHGVGRAFCDQPVCHWNFSPHLENYWLYSNFRTPSEIALETFILVPFYFYLYHHNWMTCCNVAFCRPTVCNHCFCLSVCLSVCRVRFMPFSFPLYVSLLFTMAHVARIKLIGLVLQ